MRHNTILLHKNRSNNKKKTVTFSHFLNPTHRPSPLPEVAPVSIPKKKAGTVRLIYENFNGLCPWQPHNDRLTLIKSLLRQMSTDCYLGVECRANWNMLPRKQHLRQIFTSDTPTHVVTSHNTHEKITRAQDGGTAILSFDKLAISISGITTDSLGRWSSISITNKHNHTTHIMVAYQAPKQQKKHLYASYNQQKRYYKNKGDNRCPQDIFRHDLDVILSNWKNQGHSIILFLDGNENLQRGKIKDLLYKHKMHDAVNNYTGMPGPATFFRGSKQIDGAFTTYDISCSYAAFLPLNSLIGDHRGIIIDIPEQFLYGEEVQHISRPQGRRLQCGRSDVKAKYTQKLTQQLLAHKIPQKIQQLCSPYFDTHKDEAKQLQESIDRTKSDAMRNAEKKCRKFGMGNVPYSPNVLIWKNKRDFWSLIIRFKKGKKISRSLIKRRARALNIYAPLSSSLSAAITARNECAKEFTRLCPMAGRLRRQFLRTLAKTAEEEGDLQKARDIKNIMKKEQIRQKWRTINRAIKKKGGKSVDNVTLTQDGTTISLNTQTRVEDAIMKNNSARFSLAYGTTLLDEGKLHQDLGTLANTESAQEILDGTYTFDPDTDETTISMLQLISSVYQQTRRASLSSTIKPNDYISYWKNRREATASSFSGLHFGHYKAASSSPFLASIHAKTIELAFRRQLPLTRWSTGLSVMIEKAPGVTSVDKLRALLFMEADFNYGNKLLFGQRMVKAANKHIIRKEQFAVKHSTASDLALCRLLFFDIVRQTRYNAALGSYDASQCYDCMAHPFISLAAQSIGTPKNMIGTMLLAIQSMKFHIRTAYGDSSRTYDSDPQRPFQGTCQGNGASPAIWLLLSAYLITHMKEQGHMVTIISAITSTVLSYVGLWFVDDGDIPTYAVSSNESANTVAARHQAAVTCWGNSLRVTGGSLKHSKCFWYPLNWGHKQGISYLKKISKTRTNIYLPHSDTNTPLTKLNPTAYQEVMGLIQNPIGSMKGQIIKMEKIIAKWLPLVTCGYIPSTLISQGFWGSLWPSLRYAFPCISLTKIEADKLMLPVYKQMLPKLNVARTLPLVYRYGTIKYFGLSLPNLYHEQTIAKLDTLMMHHMTPTLTNQHIQQSMEQLQLEVGIGPHFITQSYEIYGHYCTKCWLQSLWEEISTLPIQIVVNNMSTPPLLRENDAYIMEHVISSYDCTNKDLLAINRIRLHHKAYALSHIVTGNGKQYKKITPLFISTITTTINYPNMSPTSQDYQVWNRIFTSIPPPQLGSWTLHNISDTTCLYDSSQDTVYIKHNSTWIQYQLYSNHNTRSLPCYKISTGAVPNPVNLHIGSYTFKSRDRNYITFEGAAPNIYPQPPPLSISTLLAQWGNSWPWEHIQADDNGSWLPDAISRNDIIVVSDGSYQPVLSTTRSGAAWIIESLSTRQRIIGYLQTTTTNGNSYRAELTGIYAALTYILACTTVYNVTEGQLQVHCDNEKAVHLSSITGSRLPQKTQHADILRLIRDISIQLPINISFHHIYGHQDKWLPYELLDRASQLNVDCDKLAKAGLKRDVTRNCITHDILPREQISIFIDGQKATSSIGPLLRDAISKSNLRSHLHNRGIISEENFDHIDWTGIQQTMHRFSTRKRLWVTKHVSGFSATNKTLSYRSPNHTTTCPCCNLPHVEEDTHHQLFCTDPNRINLWNDSLEDLHTWLKVNDSEPNLAKVIMTYVSNKDTISFKAAGLPFFQFTDIQDKIGWINFLEGKISTEIRQIQKVHLQSISSDINIDTWIQNLISQMLHFIHVQWLYRNEVVHKKTKDGLTRSEGAAIRISIRVQLNLGIEDIDEEDHFLLQHTAEEIFQWTGEEKKLWLCAITAARQAANYNL